MASNTYDLEMVRNIGIIAHIDAGKTTTTERILYYTGRIHRLGTVDEGNTVTDWMAQERERGITIVAAAITSEWNGYTFNIIDTPGHIDFTAEVQRSMRVLDGGIVVFDAAAGVEPQSETVWRQADRYKVPRICFMNKMDKTGADFEMAIRSVHERLGANAVAVQLPMGAENAFKGVIDLIKMRAIRWADEFGAKREYFDIPAEYMDAAVEARNHLIEKASDFDDELMEMFLEGQEPSEEKLKAVIRKATLTNEMFPVFAGSALRNMGVQPVLDGVVDYLPSPLDVGAAHGFDPDDAGVELTRNPDPSEPMAALVFKIVTDPFVGRLCYFRVYSGKVVAGSAVLNSTKGKRERVGRLVRMYADRREDIEEVYAGDIAAILGTKNTTTGDTICDIDKPILLETISFPEPVIQVAIEPKTKADQDKMSEALHKLAEEDPTFKVSFDEVTGQTVIAGMGELHLDILVDRMQREFKVQANVGRPRVAYKETITREVKKAEGRFVRQSGGRGQYGHVILEMRPNDPGAGITYENAIVGGVIPKDYHNAIEAGVREAAEAGVLAGFNVVDVHVKLYDGSYHDVDSSEMAFKTAGSMAFKEGVQQGKPVLLEPIFKVDVTVPEEYMGDVIGQLSQRRAEIQGMEPRPGGVQVVRGMVPLAEMFGYATTLRSATQGRGTFSMEFDHYAPLSQSVAEQILKESGKK